MNSVGPYIFIVLAGMVIVVAMTVFILMSRKKNPASTRLPNKKSVLASSLSSEKMKSEIILSSIDDGVILFDSQKTIQLFNPAASRITSWDESEVIGIDYRTVLQFQDDRGQAYEENETPVFKAFLEKDVIHDSHANLLTKNKTVKSLDISVTPLIDASSKVIGAVGVFRDVSQQRKEEAQRAEFVSTASHEMRTPVAAIEGYLALAMNDKVSTIDSRARGYLEKAHHSTKHLGKLLQNLLASSRAEDGRLTSQPSVVEVGQFLAELVEALKLSTQSEDVSVEFVLGAQGSTINSSGIATLKPLYYIHADPDHIREVVTNLFDNAMKYTKSGKVSIGLTGDNDVVQIRVQDTGQGIPQEDIPHIFQKFYRVDNSATRAVGGTGLGLFICRQIVELYHGRIWAESNLGKGSTFYINFPRLSTKRASELQSQESSQTELMQATKYESGQQ